MVSQNQVTHHSTKENAINFSDVVDRSGKGKTEHRSLYLATRKSLVILMTSGVEWCSLDENGIIVSSRANGKRESGDSKW